MSIPNVSHQPDQTTFLSHKTRFLTSTPPVTRYIVGYKKEESDMLLKFLFEHIALCQDLQTRVKWTPGTVVVWDVSAQQTMT